MSLGPIALPLALDPLVLLAVILVGGSAGGWAASRLGAPGITGNIAAGVVIGYVLGPKLLDVGTSEEISEGLKPLSTFAMSLIAVAVGGQLSYRRIHNALRRITSISLAEAAGAVILVTLTTRLLGAPWPMAALLGCLATETAPATTIALIREQRAKGPFVKTLLSTVGVDNLLCIALSVFVMTLVSDLHREDGGLDYVLGDTAWTVFGAVFLGLAIGFLARRLVRDTRMDNFSSIFLAVLLCTGVAQFIGVSALLTSLVFGVYLSNSSPDTERQLNTLRPIEPMLYVAFFTLAGMSLHLETLADAGLLAAGYFVARFAGKALGSAAGGFAARTTARIWGNLPLALLPQAGVTIGLVVLLKGKEDIPFEFREQVAVVVLAAVTFNEVLGPFLTRVALKRSRESGLDRPRLMEFLNEEFIYVGLQAKDKWEALEEMTDFYMLTHRVPKNRGRELLDSIVEREESMTTAIGHGAAIPHGRVESGSSIGGVLFISHDGIPWNAPDDQPVKLIMLIVTPKEHEKRHLEVMASLTSMIQNPLIRERLIAARNANDAWEVIEDEEYRGYNYFIQDEGTNEEGGEADRPAH